MLGDEEHPISILFEAEQRGEHVHVNVRSGIRGMRASCGSFVMRAEEWLILYDNLTYSEPIDSRLAADISYAPPGHRSHLHGVRIVHFETSPIEITASSVAERDRALIARSDATQRELEQRVAESGER